MKCIYCKSDEMEVIQFDCEDREGFPMAVLCVECGMRYPSIQCRPEEHAEIIAKAKAQEVISLHEDMLSVIEAMHRVMERKEKKEGKEEWD